MPDVQKHTPPVPQKAIDYLGKKVKVETEKWDDLKWGEHAHALTVAHSANAGVLDEIHRLLDNAIEKGISYQDFRNGMLDMMKRSGWYGGAGHTEKEKKYINWRIGVIYDTNMRTAYAQANYREQLAGAELRPVWVYQSQLAGNNRRQEHIELHGKAFRYNDGFWDTYYPPNGWGCECYVNTESEHNAEKAGIKVADSKDITLPKIDQTWAYNVGREALAPNFAKYKNLDKETLKAVQEKYRRDMEGNKISFGELKKLKDAMEAKDYQFEKKQAINRQVGSLDKARQDAMGVNDCKIMATDERIRHAFRQKGKATVLDRYFEDAYKSLQEPEIIYEEKTPRHQEAARVFHFVKKTKDGKIINAILHKRTGFAVKVTTIDLGELEKLLSPKDLKEIWRVKK
jgi:uncharacterized protein with gpF-like domain